MPRLLTIPHEPIARFRLFSVWFAAMIAFLNVGLFAFDSGHTPSIRLGAAAAAALLGAWWLFGYRRGGLPTAGWLVDLVLVASVATVSPMPLRAIGVFYAGIQFRALYGPRRELVFLPLSYGIARVISIAMGAPDPSFPLFSLTSAVQVLALTIIAVTLHLFVSATERHAAIERALERSDERYRLVASAMRDVVYDWNVVSDTIEWTESMQNVFGFAPEAVGNQLSWWLDRVHPADLDAFHRAVRSNLADPSVAVGTVRYRVRRADDSYAHISGSMIVQRALDGRAERVIGSIRDVTSEQQLEDQLRQAQKMEAVGQLAGGVAHDFNNLLTVIGGHVFMLDQDMPPSARSTKHLEGISRAADRAASLTKQLLAFSRKQILTLSVVDVNAVVDDVLQMMRPAIGEHIQIVTRLDTSLSPIFADAGQLEQVLVNLALNARDAMPGGGTLTIETENRSLQPRPGDATAPPLPTGEYVRLTVHDSGIGMDAQTLARAFEPFFTTKAHGQGSGLGLATVYGIVKQSFGDIQASSVPGVGATFTMLFPVARQTADSPDGRQPAIGADEPRLERQRSVLLVEDDDGVRAFAHAVLSRAGYRVQSARNGIDALEQIQGREDDLMIDVVVTDVVMPEMGGRELVESLRLQGADLPVLYITGYTDDAQMVGELHATTRLLEKPFTASALALAVEELSGAAMRASPQRISS
jgi:PAS domain S-box-containing protein